MTSTATARWRPAFRPGSRTVLDAGLAALLCAVSLMLVSHSGDAPVSHGIGALSSGSRDPDAAGVLLVACSALPFTAWRRFPFGVFVVTAVAGVLLAGLGYPINLILGPPAALYVLAAGRDRETPWTVGSAGVVAGLFVAFLSATAAGERIFPGFWLVHAGLPWVVAWFAGERTRLRRAQMDELHEQARRAEHDAERDRLLAVAEERARIARDLHDSAGHAISLIAVRAGAARLRHHQDEDRSLPALEAIEELARHTAEEIDQIVGSLREDGPSGAHGLRDPEVEAPAGLSSLDTLIVHHAEAGLTVTRAIEGAPRTLGAATDQAAYRILQQALSNAARHGAGSARIRVTYTETALALTVINPVNRDAAPRPGGGHGLIGMRERATLLGGTLTTGRANGTFRVDARIPYGGSARDQRPDSR
ncbi:sensor histidine kinase [Actinomadura sp. 6N118]|uniref:sensor histidine kinase n=1 Tax=Actinomadura sp. 6N118 TaxID=3375151 RepID=UPI0037BC5B4D